jgi:renalase
VRTERLEALVRRWRADGLVAEWCRGFPGREDGHPRYRVLGGMNALAKHLARGLDVRCPTLAFTVRRRRGGWTVVDDTATEHDGDAVVLTTPVPQAFSFLVTAELETPDGIRALTYEPTLTLLAVLDGPAALPGPGALQEPDETFGFVADNRVKGVSPVPALTAHVRGGPSRAWWDDDPTVVRDRLLEAVRPYLGGASVLEAQLKRWRYATPESTWPEPCAVVESGPGPLVLAGDAFGGPRVEGAALSGLAAADALLTRLSRP